MNDGSAEKPYYMSKGLMGILGKKNKEDKEKKKEKVKHDKVKELTSADLADADKKK